MTSQSNNNKNIIWIDDNDDNDNNNYMENDNANNNDAHDTPVNKTNTALPNHNVNMHNNNSSNRNNNHNNNKRTRSPREVIDLDAELQDWAEEDDSSKRVRREPAYHPEFAFDDDALIQHMPIQETTGVLPNTTSPSRWNDIPKTTVLKEYTFEREDLSFAEDILPFLDYFDVEKLTFHECNIVGWKDYAVMVVSHGNRLQQMTVQRCSLDGTLMTDQGQMCFIHHPEFSWKWTLELDNACTEKHVFNDMSPVLMTSKCIPFGCIITLLFMSSYLSMRHFNLSGYLVLGLRNTILETIELFQSHVMVSLDAFDTSLAQITSHPGSILHIHTNRMDASNDWVVTKAGTRIVRIQTGYRCSEVIQVQHTGNMQRINAQVQQWREHKAEQERLQLAPKNSNRKRHHPSRS